MSTADFQLKKKKNHRFPKVVIFYPNDSGIHKVGTEAEGLASRDKKEK